MKTVILIPARMNSSRFPAKPLALVNGVPMISRVARIARQSVVANEVHVLADSPAIAAAEPAELMPGQYFNGTERAADYARRYGPEDVICILQGDEVTLTGRDLDYAIARHRSHVVTTLLAPVPKRRATKDDVFARIAPTGVVVEFERGKPALGWHHVGVYIATRRLLDQYASAMQTSAEIHESLEQHRWESIGIAIRGVTINSHVESVNRPSDIPLVEELLCQNASTLAGKRAVP